MIEGSTLHSKYDQYLRRYPFMRVSQELESVWSE